MSHARLFWCACTLLLVTSLLLRPASAQSTVACAADVIVRSGDTLSTLAARYLGNLAAYNSIITATNAKAAGDASYATIRNPNQLAVGMKLCIPAGGQSLAQPVAPIRATPTPTLGATPDGPTPTPTATPTSRVPVGDLHPLTIEWARGQSYPGSAITIEEVLAPGANYNRYLTAYRSEGLKIYALLTVPTGTKPPSGWPVIVFNHGYIPPEIYRTTERYVAYVDGFARNGYIVFRPDYRGHGFSDGEANGAYGHPDYTIDVLNAVASLKQYPDADPARIGMWGHSMGGFLTLRSMVISDDIKVGVIWAGVVVSHTDLMTRWRRPIPATIPQRVRRWRQELIDAYGTPDENPAFWASLSANTYLSDLSGPIQLHQGTADADVPLEFTEILNDEMIAAGQPVEIHIYEGDNHNLSINFNTVMARSVEFFDRHLKPRG